MRTTSLPSNALRSLKLSSQLVNKRDAVFMTSEAAPLPARSFNHLSVLAYLAIGIVLFASSLVIGYLIHSCYRSASRKDVNQRDTFRESPTIVDREFGTVAVYPKATSRREVGLKPLAREFCSDEESFLSDSRTVIGKRSDSSFDKPAFVSPPPHFDYSSESTPSLRLPSPPWPSPVLQKQNRQYAGQFLYSPISPSPSFSLDGSPPCILSPCDERDRRAEQQITRNNSKAKGTRRQAPRPGIQFDSNNIRYIPPLEPYVADSTVKLYNEPKLSPIHRPVISPSPGDSVLCPCHGRQTSFSQDVGIRLPSSTHSTPISTPQKRVRDISGETGQPRLTRPCCNEKVNPISRQCIAQHSWEPVLPTVRLKPGPGYF